MVFATGNWRVHVATGAPLDRPGGLHSVIKSLVRGAETIGNQAGVIHSVSRRGLEWTGELDQPRELGDRDFVAYHFAPTVNRTWNVFGSDVRRVFHFHGPWSDEARAQGQSVLHAWVKNAIELTAYRRFDRFVVASASFGEILAARYGVPDRLIRVVNPGVDTDRFRPGSRSEAQEILGLPRDRHIVACVRRLEPRMGIDVLVEAMASMPDLYLCIAGQGSMRSRLESLVRERDLTDRVRFLGRISDEMLPVLYQAASVSVVPTRSLEGFGVIVRESMACGTPVIGTRIPGLLEAMGPFGEEWSCDAGDVEGLVRLLARAVSQPAEPALFRTYAEGHGIVEAARRFDAAVFE